MIKRRDIQPMVKSSKKGLKLYQISFYIIYVRFGRNLCPNVKKGLDTEIKFNFGYLHKTFCILIKFQLLNLSVLNIGIYESTKTRK